MPEHYHLCFVLEYWIETSRHVIDLNWEWWIRSLALTRQWSGFMGYTQMGIFMGYPSRGYRKLSIILYAWLSVTVHIITMVSICHICTGAGINDTCWFDPGWSGNGTNETKYHATGNHAMWHGYSLMFLSVWFVIPEMGHTCTVFRRINAPGVRAQNEALT